MSRFSPSEAECRELVVQANERAERLAVRIVNARAALMRGQSSVVALAILDGAESACFRSGECVLPAGHDGGCSWGPDDDD